MSTKRVRWQARRSLSTWWTACCISKGNPHGPFRCLRAAKNRYGSTNEIGVFEMSDHGLLEVQNPSAAMLAGHPQGASGNCIACVMEGSRPLLAEVQALAAKTQFGVPRRTAAGVDYNRMVLLLAILEKRCGLFLVVDATCTSTSSAACGWTSLLWICRWCWQSHPAFGTSRCRKAS